MYTRLLLRWLNIGMIRSRLDSLFHVDAVRPSPSGRGARARMDIIRLFGADRSGPTFRAELRKVRKNRTCQGFVFDTAIAVIGII